MTPARTLGRPRRDEEGAVLPIAAVAMVAVVIMAAIVVDLGSTRSVRRAARSTADAAATAGAADLGVAATSTLAACQNAFSYAFDNLRVTVSASAITSACTGPLGGACSTTRREAVLTASGVTVRVVNPVPDTDALMRGSVVGGGGNQSVVAAADGPICRRIGVQITRAQSRFFGAIVDRSARTFTVHAVARYNPTPGQGATAPALVALNQTACNAIDAGNNGEINVRSLNARPALAWSDSDGSACATPSGAILVSYNSGNLRAIGTGSQPGELAWYNAAASRGYLSTSSTKTNGTYCGTCPTKWPDNENYVGRLFARTERTTRYVTDKVYRCRNVPLTIVSPQCDVSKDPITPRLALLASSSAPTGYTTYTGSCSPIAGVLPAGNWFINCPTFQIKGGAFLFRGGNVIINGQLSVEAGGIFQVNTVSTAFTAGVLPTVTTSSTQSVLMVRNGVSITSNGIASMAQTAIVNGGGLALSGGGALLWSPHTAPALDVAGSMKGLMYWTESTAAHHLQGGPNISAAGVFFAPNATLTAAGNGDIDLTKVQVWADKVQISQGGPRLTMAADPDNSVGVDKPGTSLVR